MNHEAKKLMTPAAMALLVDFGDAVKRAREDQGRSQVDVAAAANLHRSYLLQIERGERNITIAIAQAIADALEMELLALLAPERSASRIDLRRSL